MNLKNSTIPISIEGIEDTIKLLKEARDLAGQLNETLKQISEQVVTVQIGDQELDGEELVTKFSEYLLRKDWR